MKCPKCGQQMDPFRPNPTDRLLSRVRSEIEAIYTEDTDTYRLAPINDVYSSSSAEIV